MRKVLERKLTLLDLIGGILATAIVTLGLATAAQPHMESALTSLRSARKSLIEATPDKKGHRVNAIRLVDNAITEVQAGMEAH